MARVMTKSPDPQDAYERSGLEKLSSTFVAVKDAAIRLSTLYADAGVSLNPQCSLGQLIVDAINLSDAWEAGKIVDDSNFGSLLRGQHLSKILSAALPLSKLENKKKHLLDLKRGCLDPLKRNISSAKNKLWELELWEALKSHGLASSLEEPDIVVSLSSGNIGIACKRIYSAQNASKSMSYGISQIKNTGMTGILAVNIDDLVIPADCILVAPDIQTAQIQLNDFNCGFINSHHKNLLDYLSTGRASAILVATSAPLYLRDQGFSECRQIQFWVHPNLDDMRMQQMKEVEEHFFQTLSGYE